MPKYRVLHKRWLETANAVVLADDTYEADEVEVSDVGSLVLYRDEVVTHAFPPGVWMNLDIEGEVTAPDKPRLVV